MNKKLIALAVVAATVAPAAIAQTANPVTLYGRVYVMLETAKAAGGNAGAADVSSRNRVMDESLFGIRGTEDIGGGMKAFFQFETQFRTDSQDAANGGASTFANRNSGIGLQGNFGSVLLGRWDSPFRTATIATDPFGIVTSAASPNVINDRGNFIRRDQNTVQWWSPTWSGVALRAGYAANERKTVGAAVVNPSGLSMSATYTKGPIYVGYAWEAHKDQFKAYTSATVADIAGGRETGNALFGSTTLGAFKVAVQTQRYEKKTGTAATVTDIKSNQFALTYTAGKNQFVYTYLVSKGGLAQTAAVQPNSKLNVVGYFYNFSRRTSLVAQYVMITNNAAGASNVGLPGFTAGQDPRVLAVGLRHFF